MSSIPNAAIPHAADPSLAGLPDPRREPRLSPLSRAVRFLATPPLVALGFGVMAFEQLLRKDQPAVT